MASLNPRDRNLVVLSVLAFGLAGGYWYQFWSPKNLELDEIDAHVQALREVNQHAKSELAQGKTSELRAETERLERDLNVMRELVPGSSGVASVCCLFCVVTFLRCSCSRGQAGVPAAAPAAFGGGRSRLGGITRGERSR